MSDFHKDLIMSQGKRLYAERKRLEAELAEYEECGLSEDQRAMDIGQRILELDAKGALLNQEMARRNQPQQSAPLTDQEFMSLSPDRFRDPNIRDQMLNHILGKSKYFDPKKDWNDPTVQQKIREGHENYMSNLAAQRKNGQ
jgi:hypothetical protein